jgi:hypothetical protein
MALGVQIQDRVNVQAILQTAVFVPLDLKKAAHFVDSAEIPVDRRYVEATRSDFADLFDENGIPYNYAALHYSQKRLPASLQIARWIRSASKPYWIAGAHNTTLATWAAISAGSFRVSVSGTPATFDDVTGVDLTAATALSQIPGILTAKLAALTSPNVTGLDDAVFSFDVYGRLILTMPGTGAAAIAPVVGVAASGTDLSVLMDATNGETIPGYDAESIGAAIDALRAVDDTAYFYTLTPDTDNTTREGQILAFAAKIETLNKLGVWTTADTGCKDSSDDGDIMSQTQALGYSRTMGIYYEAIATRPLMIPEAAALGAVIPADEGTVSFAQEALTGVTASGFSAPLSAAQTAVIKGKGGNVIESVGGFTYLYSGQTANGEEFRIMLGRDWFVQRIAAGIFSYQIATPLAAFDAETLGAIEAIIQDAIDAAIVRRILVNTAARPAVVNIPDEDTFTAAQRKSHLMSLPDAFSAYINSNVTDYQIVGVWAQ